MEAEANGYPQARLPALIGHMATSGLRTVRIPPYPHALPQPEPRSPRLAPPRNEGQTGRHDCRLHFISRRRWAAFWRKESERSDERHLNPITD